MSTLKTATGCRPAQLFGMWCIEPTKFQRLYAQAMKCDLAALGAARKAKADAGDASEQPELLYLMAGTTAVITLSGPFTKYTTSFEDMFGGTSTLRSQRAIRSADVDPEVSSIMLIVDSPGGTVDGTADLAEAVAGTSKLIHAYVQDNACSAAYWVASQADRVCCNTTASVGCIGVIYGLDDTSKAYEQDGVRAVIITSGDDRDDNMKGAGADGTPITDKQIEYWRGLAKDINAEFGASVASGRGMSPAEVDAASNGRVWIGQKAADMKLVDRVCSFDDAMKQLRSQYFLGAAADGL